MQIEISIKNVYGNDMVYPACDTAKRFAALTGTKTFTKTHLEHIQALGYELFIVPQELSVA